MATYRVLIGSHHHKGRTYRAPEVFESDVDMLRFNGPKDSRLPPKFEKVDVPQRAQAQQVQTQAQTQTVDPAKEAFTKELDDYLPSLTQKELQAYAASEDIDLKGVKSKEDMIRVIKQGMLARD